MDMYAFVYIYKYYVRGYTHAYIHAYVSVLVEAGGFEAGAGLCLGAQSVSVLPRRLLQALCRARLSEWGVASLGSPVAP